MRLVIYTAIFGDMPDFLNAPKNIPADVELHAYVDGIKRPEQHETGWELMPALWEHKTNPRLRARRHKLLSHVLYPQVDYTLWLDGCLTPIVNPTFLLETYLNKTDICLFRHMERDCVYDEADACIKLRKDSPKILNGLKDRYRAEQYPAHNGLAETTAVLRRHTPEIKALNHLWWEELRKNSIRDQMSFNYVAWKLGVNYSTFAGTRPSSPYFEWRAHR